MKTLFLILSFFALASFSQEKQATIDADAFIGVDNLENIYYVKNNVLYKKSAKETISYTNLHLGKIDLVDITNPLKIVVFYKDFNSVLILDDALNELSNPINFNEILFKNSSFIGTSTNANLWLFSKDDNTLMLFNTTTKKVFTTQQIMADFNFQKAFSNYHYIWLVSKSSILKYNAYGSFISEENIKNVKQIKTYKKAIIYQVNEQLFYLDKTNNLQPLSINKELNLKDFYINNDYLYFFDGKSIYRQEFIKK